jgi:hypothetical protein
VSFGLFHWLWTALCMVMLVEASTNVSATFPYFWALANRFATTIS